ncbi:MAG TPA: glycosyltransferase family 39 protein [Candidatus Dormibacteraeota bacterium]|nr:glycosyltransferase family 39 protein [Candidatus Dormibacteraeota bacterium]
MQRPTRAALSGALLSALLVLPGLNAGTLWDNSETIYGEVAREILLTHNWVVLHYNGLPWFVQPPLYFWIAALFAKVLGVGSLAMRLPAALATIAMGAMTGYAVARQLGMRTGVFAAAILSSALMQAIIGRLAIMDALLDCAVAMTIFWWFRSVQTGRRRYFIFGAIAAGLGFLAKGPVAPVIAVLVMLPYSLWNARCESTKLPAMSTLLYGALAFAATIAPWFLALIAQTGVVSVALLIGHYTIGRYTSVIENQSGPIWYYLPVLIVGFFPWIALLPSAVVDGIGRLRTAEDSERARVLRLAFCWAVVPLLFFSFARTKLPNYIALELPAFALICAIYLDGLLARSRMRAALVATLAVPLVIGLLAIAVALFARDNHLGVPLAVLTPALSAMGLTIAIGGFLMAMMLMRRRSAPYAPFALTIAMAVAIDVLGLVALPRAEVFKPVPRLARFVDRIRKPGDVVVDGGIVGGGSLLFYTKPPVALLSEFNGDIGAITPTLRAVICSAPRAFVFYTGSSVASEPHFGRRTRVIARDGNVAVMRYSGAGCTHR